MCTIIHPATSLPYTVSTRTGKLPSPTAKNDTGSFSDREFRNLKDTASIILSSWRGNTQKQYGSYLKKWSEFCNWTMTDKFYPSVANILKFLTELHEPGLGYSALNTGKSSISSFLSIANPTSVQIGSHVLIKRFMKGIFEI